MTMTINELAEEIAKLVRIAEAEIRVNGARLDSNATRDNRKRSIARDKKRAESKIFGYREVLALILDDPGDGSAVEEYLDQFNSVV